jgi:hypothetical protein
MPARLREQKHRRSRQLHAETPRECADAEHTQADEEEVPCP